eukprot:jgi/Psemu1/22644/gm1.22644_g
MKFPPPEPVFVQQSMIMRIVKLGNNNEIPNMINVKDQKWSGILCQTRITMCRHNNAQTLARKNYKVSPKQTDFKRKSFRTTVSNIFTPSDEAFVLLLLYNDHGSWLNTTKGTRKRKKFTDSKEEQQSKDLEIELLKKYQQQNGNHTQWDIDEDEERRKEKRRKQQSSTIETLGKDDVD